MSAPLARTELLRFRHLVSQRLGLHFDDDKLDQLADVLVRRLRQAGICAGQYLDQLAVAVGLQGELSAVAAELTVGETYFYRHPDHFHALVGRVLPERLEARRTQRALRLLSAGCATGEEAYTLALLLHEQRLALTGWKVEILGLDLNPVSLAKARRGRYTAWSLRGTPAEVHQRYFQIDGKEFILREPLRFGVRFEQANLVDQDAACWAAGEFDVIFCRNVLMYFAPETARAVVARLTRALLPGGFLFLGPAETLRGVSQNFHLCHTHETFYYQQRTAPAGAQSETVLYGPHDANLATTSLLPASVGPEDNWVGAISQASERINLLASQLLSGLPPQAPVEPVLPVAVQPVAAATDLRAAHELVRAERFEAAFEVLQQLPAAAALDADALLLRAVILTNRGAVAEAEHACRQVLQRDELNAGAHYLLALCREHADDRRTAIDENQTAVYLDPAFAMPRLHLGLLAKRSGDLETARQEFRRALVLLEREDASRILLLGGGFSRESLVQLCRAELRLCGDRG